MPKTKNGEVITWKEFFKLWGKGIEGITAYQQVKAQIQGTYIITLGIILGIISTLFNIKLLWWVLIILIGGLINTIIGLIGLIQKKNMLKNFEKLNYEIEPNAKTN